MRLCGAWTRSGRQRRNGRAYARFLEATIGLIDESAKPHTCLARNDLIEITAAILRVAEADRALRVALAPPGSTRQLETAVHELDEARSVLQEAARSSLPDEPRHGTVNRRPLICGGCGGESPPDARGWRAYILADDGVGICCPICGELF